MEKQHLFRPEALAQRWGMSASSIRRFMNAGRLPPPVRLSERIYGWSLATIERIEAERNKAAGKKGAK